LLADLFLLREVFDYGYDEIATVVGKSEENCRQMPSAPDVRSR
jgi:DNA-directed RNA polymerase specialized sigma24 family protein